ncbi:MULTISPECIES: hypothetical protein [unclassified Leuconostoc]|uniref:hypothetical protein n=1 Tax=unclassified Leuconostoc TaxID=2685106 RepID=UPI0019070623|nr:MULTISPECIES: hypothetical protein [unclassified Leuconostoc]MBK0041527.1 hypothetical protein [Leuconostoc sp. S51]MBK0052468.1 hypothetical protein [Leuconostoc sp. S50]
MAITGYQFDMQAVPASKDASVIHALTGESNGVLRRGNDFAITANGLQVTIGTGQAIIQGRLVEVTSNESVTLPANSTGKICIVVDLTKTNSVVGVPGQSGYSATINQVYVLPVVGSLTQDDLNNGGYIYELPLATFTTTSNSATIVQTNSIFNDTGWKQMTLADGAKFNSKSNQYAKYRVINNMVTIIFDGIDLTGTSGKNQIFKLTQDIAPAITPYQAMLFPIVNFDDNNSNTYPATGVVSTDHIYARWNTNTFGASSFTHASGTIIYFIG